MRRPRLGAAAGTPRPRTSGRWAGLPAIHALRRSAGPFGSANVSRGPTGVRPYRTVPYRPVDRLSYTVTMRSIIPACEALASTDDRPHDPAPAAAPMARSGSRALRGAQRRPGGHGVHATMS